MRRHRHLLRNRLGRLAVLALFLGTTVGIQAQSEPGDLTNEAQGFISPDLLPPVDDGGPVLVDEPPIISSACKTAEVVALDQVYYWNRLGAFEPQGQMYALKHDVVASSQPELVCGETKQPLVAGSVKLRRNKRPRPLVLRMNVGECLDVVFTNLLRTPYADPDQPWTRKASVHVVGLNYRVNGADGGMWVGTDANGQVAPGGSITYRLFAEKEGTFLLYNGAVMTGGGEGEGGTISTGLFGAVNVEPAGAKYYRSQVTEKELRLATGVGGVIDYTKTYGTATGYATDPDLCFHASTDPILAMVNSGNRIVHSDLTAIIANSPTTGGITAPAGIAQWENFPVYKQDPLPADRADRLDGFREFTIIFHDEVGAVQAFPHFEDEILSHTLHSVRDAFAINYGTGGAGAEILANRLRVGPMWDCIDCKYEEFFLTAWAVGDPAMVVDKPANWPCSESDLKSGAHQACLAALAAPANRRKATRVFYPDDPSNVYHSYLNDNVRFRNLHAGSEDHHIFHLHAHQWQRTPNSDKSAYLDSQAIGQGSSFTYEIAHGGSGNLNKTVGDSIFHCHFYPHFAQGMWSMWRTHDVYEKGTALGTDGRPTWYAETNGTVVTTARALPDGEILYGTPIPAIVPIPGEVLPPLPTAVQLKDGQIDVTFTNNDAQAKRLLGNPAFNPGYPFFIPGVAGHRPPHPPMDFALDGTTPRDGGLPRHVVVPKASGPYIQGPDFDARFDRHANTKEYLRLKALQLPEQGTPLEKIAMDTHAFSEINGFRLNGRQPAAGAPFADPCLGTAPLRKYKAADVQIDAKFTKDGWHFNQQRIITLVDDVPATLAGTKPPEPFFFRANSGDCIQYELTNLVPYEYMNDDFQVRTPTDIIAQHIHLVKFDVTSSDGGGNGFNYEDGTFAPEEVQERITAIRDLYIAEGGSCPNGAPTADASGRLTCPVAKIDPRFGEGPDVNCDGHKDFKGAQTTVQRWYADPQFDLSDKDRTLRTVFTHDHFGPSTHQQVGLYAGLVIEPAGSTWYHSESGTTLGTRQDGGPTTWQARIEAPPKQGGPFREFMLEFSDFQLAYERQWPQAGACPDLALLGWSNPQYAINAPGREDNGPHSLYVKPVYCPTNDTDPDGSIVPATPALGGRPVPPCPEAVSAADPGFSVINYRAEPLAARIKSAGTSQQTGTAGDLSFAYESRIDRANPEYNKLPYWTGNAATGTPYFPYPALTGGLVKGDPVTPLIRVYEGDKVKLRTLVGGFEEEHSMVVHANRWLYEPDDPASGYKGFQMNGISEWFDLEIPPIPFLQSGKVLDMLYKPSAAAEWQWNGLWGIIRVGRTRSLIERDFGALSALSDNSLGEALTDTEKTAAYATASSDELVPTDLDPAGLAEPEPALRPVPGSEEVPTDTTVGFAATTDISNARDLSAALRIYPYPTAPAPLPVSCPTGSTRTALRTYDIAAVAAREVLPSAPGIGKSLVYNARAANVRNWDSVLGNWNGSVKGPLHDPTAIMFVPFTDLNFVSGRPRLNATAPVEPLILRARAGECIRVRLVNLLPKYPTGWTWGYDMDGWNGWHMLYQSFNANDVRPSMDVSLHPQLVYFDPARSDGSNVGVNPAIYGKQSVSPNNMITYYWYAGSAQKTATGTINVIPIEFGATGLTSSDPLKHTNKGAVGALIIEPAGATWSTTEIGPYLPTEPQTRITRASATVSKPDGTSFKEFVAVFQNDLNLRYATTTIQPQGALLPVDPLALGQPYWKPVENLSVLADPTESGQKAFNYRTEPMWFRMAGPSGGAIPEGYTPNAPPDITKGFDFSNIFTNAKVGGAPVTPIFRANAGQQVRFRVVEPGGHTQAHVWEVTGHLWPERPYANDSRSMTAQPQSEYQGSRYGVGPGHHSDSYITKAGGYYSVPAQYMYKDYVGWGLASGLWGVFAVGMPFP